MFCVPRVLAPGMLPPSLADRGTPTAEGAALVAIRLEAGAAVRALDANGGLPWTEGDARALTLTLRAIERLATRATVEDVSSYLELRAAVDRAERRLLDAGEAVALSVGWPDADPRRRQVFRVLRAEVSALNDARQALALALDDEPEGG